MMRRELPWLLPLLSWLGSVMAQSTSESAKSEICISPTRTFTFKVDLFASEWGYYTVEECGDQVNPILGMEFGETYTFLQLHHTNYFHPLRFSYFPDGDHVGADLLTPGNRGTNMANSAGETNPKDDCRGNQTCPAPMYFLNDGYLGTYSNDPNVLPVTTNELDDGWDMYKEFYLRDMIPWRKFGQFKIQLKFDDESYNEQDIFYYCYAHQYMAGRIKLLKNGQPVNPKNQPAIYYQEEKRGEFDEMCGTSGLDNYQVPHPECPHQFVCDVEDDMKEFASCISAMDCLMMVGMTNGVSSESELALFIHQMIPHHQNAVNMAKALLKAGFLPCDDLTDQEDPYCVMQSLLHMIVARQNHEIGIMRKALSDLDLPPTDDCQVVVRRLGEGGNDNNNNRPDFLRKGVAATTAAGAILGAATHAF